MVNVNLASALELIESTSAKERTEGYDELKRQLRNSSSIDSAQLQKLYDGLLRGLQAGKIVYEKSLRSSSKTACAAAINKLSTCSASLRLATEKTVTTFKFKTARRLLDSLTSGFSDLDTDICVPVVLDQVKSINTILGYQPHLEHLPFKDWQALLRHAISRIAYLVDRDSLRSRASTDQMADTTYGLTPAVQRNLLSEYSRTLTYLTSNIVASVTTNFRPICELVIKIINMSKVASDTDGNLLTSLNNIIGHCRTENPTLLKDLAFQIITLADRLWPRISLRSTDARDELVRLLVLLMPVFRVDLVNANREDYLVTYQNLLDNMVRHITARPLKELLQLNDIRLIKSSKPTSIALPFLSLRSKRVEAHRNWTVLSTLTFLLDMLNRIEPSIGNSDDVANDSTPRRKRVRGRSLAQDLLSIYRESSASSSVFATQLIIFSCQAQYISLEDVRDLLDFLIGAMDDENMDLAPWVILGCCSLVSSTHALHISLKDSWVALWRKAQRGVEALSTCRVSCYLLSMLVDGQLIEKHIVSENSTSVTMPSLWRIPVTFDEGALAYTCTILNFCAANRPILFDALSESALQWLCTMLNANFYSDNDDRLENRNTLLTDVLDLFCTSMRQPKLCFEDSIDMQSLQVSTLRLIDESCEPLEYFLTGRIHCVNAAVGLKTKIEPGESHTTGTFFARRINLVIRQLSSVVERWKARVEELGGIVSEIDIRCAAFSLQLISFIRQSRIIQFSTDDNRLFAAADDLMKAICHCLGKSGTPPNRIDVLLDTFLTILRHQDSAGHPSNLFVSSDRKYYQWLYTLATSSSAFGHPQLARSNDSVQDVEMGDSDDFDDSTRVRVSQSRSQSDGHNPMSLISFNASICNRLLIKMFETCSLEQCNQIDYSHIVEELSSMSASDIIASRAVIMELDIFHVLTEDIAIRILNILSEQVMKSYIEQLNQASVELILNFLIKTFAIWIHTTNRDLAGLVMDFYEYIVQGTLPQRVLHKQSQILLSELLVMIWEKDENFAQEEDPPMPSVRTTLFNLLGQGSLALRFNQAERIPTIFSYFTITNHEALFDDLEKNLPADADWLEGISIRLAVFANLGSRWQSLLRRSVFGILDAAGQVQGCLTHAHQAITSITTAHGFTDECTLFRAFSSQLLYSWMSTRNLHDIPFVIFGFETLPDLIQANSREITAQCFLCDKDEEFKLLEHHMKLSKLELVRDAYADTIAYAVAHDTSQPGGQAKTESKIRELFQNKNEYVTLAKLYLPMTIAKLIIATDIDSGLDRAFEKKRDLADVSEAITAMTEFANDTRPPMPISQPSFRARHLLDSLDRIARRAGLEMKSLFRPQLFVAVVRKLLDLISPALGSTHTRAILFKIRLVCAFGQQALTAPYPVNTLIQAMRPFLHDAQCAQEAISIIWFCYKNGFSALSKTRSKVVASILTTITMLRLAAGQSFDPLTQESQRHSTLAHLDKLRQWLVELVLAFKEPWNERQQQRLLEMVRACNETNYPAILDDKIPSGTYFTSLLVDCQSSTPILDEADRTSMIQLLMEHSQGSSYGDDQLHQRTIAVKFLPMLWTCVKTSKLTDGVCQWFGKLMGRSYSMSGPSFAEKILHSGVNNRLLIDSDFYSAVKFSRKIISDFLVDNIHSFNPIHVSLAEDAIRNMIHAFKITENINTIQEVLSTQIFEAFDINYETTKSAIAIDTRTLSKPYVSLHHGLSSLIDLARTIVLRVPNEASMSSLNCIEVIPESASKLLAPMLHLALVSKANDSFMLRSWLSETYRTAFAESTTIPVTSLTVLLDCLLYLLCRPVDKETTRLDRLEWLDIDFISAARAALSCKLPKHALFLLEQAPRFAAKVSKTRRSSTNNLVPIEIPNELMLAIFEMIEDPDIYYSVDRLPTLDSIVQRMERQQDPLAALMLHSACLDSTTRLDETNSGSHEITSAIALGSLNLNSLTQNLLRQQSGREDFRLSDMSMKVSQRLYQWDVQVPALTSSGEGLVFKMLQHLQHNSTIESSQLFVTETLGEATKILQNLKDTSTKAVSFFHAMAIASDIQAILQCNSGTSVFGLQSELDALDSGWGNAYHGESMDLIADRETIFGIVRRNTALQNVLQLKQSHAILLEAKAVVKTINSSRTYRKQAALAGAMYLTKLIPSCTKLGIHVDAVADRQMASILWDQKEPETSVRLLRTLIDRKDMIQQSIEVGKADLLAQLAHQVAEARLERPEEILTNYLQPALASLTSTSGAVESASVFHEFASFCSQQLQNPDNIADLQRVDTLREKKRQEIKQLEVLYNATPVTDKDARADISRSHRKTKQWYELDQQEFKRLDTARIGFVRFALENYLKVLQVSDKYDSVVVPFFALWLQNDQLDEANTAVAEYMERVPSWKFVQLLNQIMSRLLDTKSKFQSLLSKLVTRIYAEHPYHSIHLLFSSCMTTVIDTDKTGMLRQSAARIIAKTIRADHRVGSLVSKVWEANTLYHELAMTKIDTSKTTKFSIHKLPIAAKLNKRVGEMRIPPATLQLELRPNGDYAEVPFVIRFREEVSVASGLSAPKIMTARASDGNTYKQLFKGGNDDLRQDAIMEQVFASVSKMLRNHPNTRRRDLHIRTYTVIPLSSVSGIIEFVPNSIPLHDFVVPAHTKYNPSDLDWNKAREIIKKASEQTLEQRVTVYRNVAKQYSPVLRHFFFERFGSPSVWFEKRRAYSRSTAAISILGHILGLGDRHCHNILLDELSGEVIHIDLGVAFEAGRILPIPEGVPFRMTRDIVDAMGITGVEGIFRRCCESVLEALREEKAGIMTLLNVLRYDPLYSWTVSPLRAKRMQQDDGGTKGADASAATGFVAAAAKANAEAARRVEEMNAAMMGGSSEAERALAVVERKLGKNLSAQAAVNELIQVATDEKNLAVLFAGWAAFS